jgi:hypothetical protein
MPTTTWKISASGYSGPSSWAAFGLSLGRSIIFSMHQSTAERTNPTELLDQRRNDQEALERPPKYDMWCGRKSPSFTPETTIITSYGILKDSKVTTCTTRDGFQKAKK